MSRVTRESFVQDMSSGKGLDVNALSPEAQAALKKAGIDQATLKNMAGADGIISGKNELDALFTLIDTKDRDGNYHSIKTTKRDEQGKEVATVSGQLMEALSKERERARLGGPAAPPANRPVEDSREPLVRPGASPATAPLPNFQDRPSAASHSKAVATLKADGFTDIHLAKDTPYFNQADRRWAKHSYPKVGEQNSTRALAKSGCAPTALAMADATLRGNGTTPAEVADFAVQKKVSGAKNGFGTDTHGLAKAWAKEHDLTYTPATSDDKKKNVDTIRDGLKAGGVAVISVGVDPKTGKGHFTEKGHVMVINGYAKDKQGNEWFFVVNPGRREQRGSKGDVDNHVMQTDGLHLAAGQVRISREQLEKEMKSGMVLSNKAR